MLQYQVQFIKMNNFTHCTRTFSKQVKLHESALDIAKMNDKIWNKQIYE